MEQKDSLQIIEKSECLSDCIPTPEELQKQIDTVLKKQVSVLLAYCVDVLRKEYGRASFNSRVATVPLNQEEDLRVVKRVIELLSVKGWHAKYASSQHDGAYLTVQSWEDYNNDQKNKDAANARR